MHGEMTANLFKTLSTGIDMLSGPRGDDELDSHQMPPSTATPAIAVRDTQLPAVLQPPVPSGPTAATVFLAAAVGALLSHPLSTLINKHLEARSARSRALSSEAASRIAASRAVDELLSPVISSADALLAKMFVLSQKDYDSPTRDVPANAKGSSLAAVLNRVAIRNVVHLYGQFWGYLEIVKQASRSVPLREDPRGHILLALAECIESVDIRLLPREYHCLLGSAMISGDGKQCMDFFAFCHALDSEDRYFHDLFHLFCEQALLPAFQNSELLSQQIARPHDASQDLGSQHRKKGRKGREPLQPNASIQGQAKFSFARTGPSATASPPASRSQRQALGIYLSLVLFAIDWLVAIEAASDLDGVRVDIKARNNRLGSRTFENKLSNRSKAEIKHAIDRFFAFDTKDRPEIARYVGAQLSEVSEDKQLETQDE